MKRVCSASSARLWNECVERVLAEVGDCTGPTGYAAYLWANQNRQLDALYETAYARGLPGWLAPPFTTLRDLAVLFELRARRVGPLTRRRLISRVSRSAAHDAGLSDPTHTDGVVRGHMLDDLFGELLPEGIAPEQLQQALATLPGDAFARRRNAWIVGSYAAYLHELARSASIDQRQAWAMVADAIDAGALKTALGGATTLHVFGLYMARSRTRLLRALARQSEVEVVVYTLREPEPDEWDDLIADVEDLDACGEPQAPTVSVQPVPDTQREMEWVARQVKGVLSASAVEPHRVAVVARSGHEDTGRVQRALCEAGVAASAIVRARLTEIAALKALGLLFRGAPRRWNYRALRAVLDHAYFDLEVDLRSIDFIARKRRVEGLAAWQDQLEALLTWVEDAHRDDDTPLSRDARRARHEIRRAGLWPNRVRRDVEAFRAVRANLERLGEPRKEAAWIELALDLIRDRDGRAFGLRARVCEPVDGLWDVVRLDQRGLVQTEALLREWFDLEHSAGPLSANEWLTLWQRLLEANELAISTPQHKGVQVLEAHDAALTPFEHVFVVHANDGIFPRAIPTGGVLSGDERKQLCEAGVPLSHRDLDLRRERTLWRSVTSAGSVRVSYRTADASGTPLLPSLMVPEHDPGSELPRTRRPLGDDRFAPVTPAQANSLASQILREHRDQAAQGIDASGATDAGSVVEHRILPAADANLVAFAVVAAVAESHRDTGHEPLTPEHAVFRPNPWNGWLRDPRVLASLGRRFSADFAWSASALEAYSRCPFEYLVGRVLGFEQVAEADEETTPLIFGGVAHDLLESFYERLLGDVPTAFDARAQAAFDAAAESVRAVLQERGEWLGASDLWEQSWRGLVAQVKSFLVWELGHLHEKSETPRLLEHEFGFDEPVWVEGVAADGQRARLRLRGRIDRVDQGPKGYQVLDYKSGGMPGANDYEDGTALQAPLYMHVLEHSGSAPSLGYYRSLKKAKRPTQYGGKIVYGSAKYGAALGFALSVPARLRAGCFEATRSRKAGVWPGYAPGREIARSRAVILEGHRFAVEPLAPALAPAPRFDSAGDRDAPHEDTSELPITGVPRLPFDDPGSAT